MQNDTFKKWIYFAEQDLNFAKFGLRDKFYSHVCFLSQQTAEKSCKAFLIYNNLSYPKTHKIVEIINSDKKLLDLLKNFIDEIKLLDAFYIPTRYPDGIPGSLPEGLPDEKDAESSLSIAEKIFNLIGKEIDLKKMEIIGMVDSGDLHFADNTEEYLKESDFGKD